MICEFSGKTMSVSDYDIISKTARCPSCRQIIKITIPDKVLFGNVAKFRSHSKPPKEDVGTRMEIQDRLEDNA
jgi:hypothetical protein